MISQHEIRRGVYYDSVLLMQLQRSLAALPDIVDAAVVMATPAISGDRLLIRTVRNLYCVAPQ